MSIKLDRAAKLCDLARYPASYAAMLDAIPASIIDALTARQIAELVDANWRLAQASKALRADEVISDGGIFDDRRGQFRALAA